MTHLAMKAGAGDPRIAPRARGDAPRSTLPIVRRYYRAVFGVRATATAAVIAPDLRAVMHAVSAGAGISVLPRYLCADFLARGELIEIGAPGVAVTSALYLATRAASRRHPRVDLVAEMLRRAAAGW